MTYSASSRKDVRLAEKSARLKLVLRGEVISGIMSVANGREWMYDLLAESFVFADPFHHDPCIAAYNSGLRANGIRLFNDIVSFCPHQFPVMLGEHYARSAASDERTSKQNSNGRDLGSGNAPAGDSDDYDPYGDSNSGAEAPGSGEL